MNPNLLDKDPHLRSKLDEYHVEAPDFPMKASKSSRFIRFLGSPAKDPFESLISTENGMLALKVAPVAGGFGLLVLQLAFFL
ncbi:hypothetical protein [Planococcus sp. YIM B11945]|uniref:hypothetical protein n=1 Tax=Planococcus sp. YIM B11945 TaxID=3435410 RepID=UPI003D7D178B